MARQESTDPMSDSRIQQWMRQEHERSRRTNSQIIEAMGSVVPPDQQYPQWRVFNQLPKKGRYEIPQPFLDAVGIPVGSNNKCRRNALIEIIGLPETGKSTLGRGVVKLIDGRYDFVDEFISSIWDPEQNPGISLKQIADVVAQTGETRERFYNRAKLIHANEILTRNFAPPVQETDPFRHTLTARGFNDLLLGLRRNWMQYSHSEIINYLSQTFGGIEHVDAVILMGISYHEAIKRRKAAGKEETSYMVNPKLWPIINEAYSWWLKKLYPIIRKAYGTGVLVLDAENDFRANLAKTMIYLGQVANLCEADHF